MQKSQNSDKFLLDEAHTSVQTVPILICQAAQPSGKAATIHDQTASEAGVL